MLDGIKNKTGMDLVQWTVSYIKTHEANKDNKTLKLTFGNKGEYETAIFRYQNSSKGLKPIIVHKFILVNTKKDKVAIITFETTQKMWQKMWNKYGKIAMKSIFITQ